MTDAQLAGIIARGHKVLARKEKHIARRQEEVARIRDMLQRLYSEQEKRRQAAV